MKQKLQTWIVPVYFANCSRTVQDNPVTLWQHHLWLSAAEHRGLQPWAAAVRLSENRSKFVAVCKSFCVVPVFECQCLAIAHAGYHSIFMKRNTMVWLSLKSSNYVSKLKKAWCGRDEWYICSHFGFGWISKTCPDFNSYWLFQFGCHCMFMWSTLCFRRKG